LSVLYRQNRVFKNIEGPFDFKFAVEGSMQKKTFLLLAVVQVVFTIAMTQSHAQSPAYPTMAPLAQYLMPEADEIALARSAAPKSVSDDADVMVLTKNGYVTAAKGSNGFLCIVERGWAGDSNFADFWNPRQRSPNCFNPAATKTFVPIYLMKTRLVLEGKSKAEITREATTAIDSKKLPPLAPGAMCYMMSKQQYLNDQDKNWHPHLMFFVAGDVGKSWGANLPDSPLIAANDPEERVTIFMMMAENWSDGSPFSR
jgi:hypothetical protein